MAKIALAPSALESNEAMTELVLPFLSKLVYMIRVFYRDDHYYHIQSERSQLFSEKETLEKVYAALLEEHRSLQTTHDDILAEKEEARAQLRQLQRELGSKRSEKSDGMARAEIDRLRTDL